MKELFNELLSFIEANANRWEDAAKRCEEVAEKLSPSDRAQWLLLSAAFKENAGLHRNIVAGMRGRVDS